MSNLKTGLTLEPGECFSQYEIGGIIFRVGPPRLITRTEGDQTICRFECEMETIFPAEGPGAKRPEQEPPPRKDPP